MLVTISDRKIMMLPDDQGCTAGTANDILNVYTRNNEPSYVARQEVNLLDGFESINDDDFVAYTDNSLGICAVVDPASPPAGSYYRADVITANDYYPGGMQMPGRKYSVANTNYRYGFTGHEKMDEIYGSGNAYDMGARMLDIRLGRTGGIDPKAALYPGISPYAYALNTPINAIDPDGKLVIFINGQHTGTWGKKYWNGFDEKVKRRIGDNKSRYYDGALGGFKNTLSPIFSSQPWEVYNTNLFHQRGIVRDIFKEKLMQQT